RSGVSSSERSTSTSGRRWYGARRTRGAGAHAAKVMSLRWGIKRAPAQEFAAFRRFPAGGNLPGDAGDYSARVPKRTENRKHTMISVATRPDLAGLTPEAAREALAGHFASRGQPAYRVEQVLGWLYERLAFSFG